MDDEKETQRTSANGWKDKLLDDQRKTGISNPMDEIIG